MSFRPLSVLNISSITNTNARPKFCIKS